MALNPALRAMVEAAAAKYQEPDDATGLLDWMTPLGKPLGDCTGHEVGLLAELLTTQANVKLAEEQATRDALADAIGHELCSFFEHDSVDFCTSALTDNVVLRLTELSVTVPKPRIRARATTQHTA